MLALGYVREGGGRNEGKRSPYKAISIAQIPVPVPTSKILRGFSNGERCSSPSMLSIHPLAPPLFRIRDRGERMCQTAAVPSDGIYPSYPVPAGHSEPTRSPRGMNGIADHAQSGNLPLNLCGTAQRTRWRKWCFRTMSTRCHRRYR